MRTTVYVDMDDVLADFKTGIEKIVTRKIWNFELLNK